MHGFRKTGMAEMEAVRELFFSVFAAEPWNDDWSDRHQLSLYLTDLMGQGNSLAYGLYENGILAGVCMGHVRHWYSGTEYVIDEFCIRGDMQGRGLGTYFLHEIEKAIREEGIVQIFLQTEKDVPAYDFYRKNGFMELPGHVSFTKRVTAGNEPDDKYQSGKR